MTGGFVCSDVSSITLLLFDDVAAASIFISFRHCTGSTSTGSNGGSTY